jgi:hypothetical protein
MVGRGIPERTPHISPRLSLTPAAFVHPFFVYLPWFLPEHDKDESRLLYPAAFLKKPFDLVETD